MQSHERMLVRHRHASLVRDVQTLFVTDVQCLLCNGSKRTQYEHLLRHHVMAMHWKRRVPYADKYVVPCNLMHCLKGAKPLYHYHCPGCGKVMRQRCSFVAHIYDCTGAKERLEMDVQNIIVNASNQGPTQNKHEPLKHMRFLGWAGWTVDFTFEEEEVPGSAGADRHIGAESVHLGPENHVKSVDTVTHCDDHMSSVSVGNSQKSNISTRICVERNPREKLHHLFLKENDYLINLSRQKLSAHKIWTGNDHHMSMVHSLFDLPLRQCTDACCKGRDMYHCPLCWSPNGQTGGWLQIHQHMSNMHWKQRIKYRGLSLLSCHQTCDGAPHWHCPCCGLITSQQKQFQHHLNSHKDNEDTLERGAQLEENTESPVHADKLNTHLCKTDKGHLAGRYEPAPQLGPHNPDSTPTQECDSDSRSVNKTTVVHTQKQMKTSEAKSAVLNQSKKEPLVEQAASVVNQAHSQVPQKVFQLVAAVLLPEMLQHIPGNRGAYFRDLEMKTGVQSIQASSDYCVLQGDWAALSDTHAILNQLRLGSSGAAAMEQGSGLAETRDKENRYVLNMCIKQEQTSDPVTPCSQSSNHAASSPILIQPAVATPKVDSGVKWQSTRKRRPSRRMMESTIAAKRRSKASHITNASLSSHEGSCSLKEGANGKTDMEALSDVISSGLSYSRHIDAAHCSQEHSMPASTSPAAGGSECAAEKGQSEFENGEDVMKHVDVTVDLEGIFGVGGDALNFTVINQQEKAQDDILTTNIDTSRVSYGEGNQSDMSQNQLHLNVLSSTDSVNEHLNVLSSTDSVNEQNLFEDSVAGSCDSPKRDNEHIGAVKQEECETNSQSRNPIILTQEQVSGSPHNTSSSGVLFKVLSVEGRHELGLNIPAAADEVGSSGQGAAPEWTDEELDGPAPDDGEPVSTEQDKAKKPADKLTFCPVCAKTFRGLRKLRRHLLKAPCGHSKNSSYLPAALAAEIQDAQSNITGSSCVRCQKTFCDRHAALLHYLQRSCVPKLPKRTVYWVKQGDFQYHCIECQQCFPAKHLVNAHYKQVHQNLTYDCPKCDRKFLAEKHLKRHQEYAHKQEPVICHVCGKSLKPTSIRYHMLRHSHPDRVLHHNNRDYDLQCPKCDFKTRSASQLYRHRKVVHESRAEVCEVCGSQFALRCDLTKHHLNVHQAHMVQCPQCQKSMKKQCLNRHMQRQHGKDLPFVCSICHRGFHSNFNLKRHINSQRNKDGGCRPDVLYPCSQCEMQFRSRVAYRNHVAKHDTALYQCDQCDQKFVLKRDLNIHRAAHTGREFQCDICNSKFLNAKYLARHRQRHMVAMNYICICGSQFETADVLAEHQLTCKPEENIDAAKDLVQSAIEEVPAEGLIQGAIVEVAEHKEPLLDILLTDSMAVEEVISLPPEETAPSEQFQCGYCQALYSSYDVVQQHILTEHIQDVPGALEEQSIQLELTTTDNT